MFIKLTCAQHRTLSSLLLSLHLLILDIIPHDHHHSVSWLAHREIKKEIEHEEEEEDRIAEGESKLEWEIFRKKYKISQTYPITAASHGPLLLMLSAVQSGIREARRQRGRETCIHIYTHSIIAVWDQSVGGKVIIAWWLPQGADCCCCWRKARNTMRYEEEEEKGRKRLINVKQFATFQFLLISCWLADGGALLKKISSLLN